MFDDMQSVCNNNLTWIDMNPGHQPERFEVYKQLPNGTGFTLPDNPHIFLYDRYGGWLDEYGNYYNEHGQPDDPPSSEDSHSHSASPLASPQASEDEEDPYQAEFGVPHDLTPSQSSDEEGAAEAGRVEHNLLALHSYPLQQPLRVYFRNLPFKTKKDELMKAYSSQVDCGLLNAVIDTDEEGRGIGTGYFVTTVQCAEKIVKLQGRRLLSRPLAFQIQDYQNFMVFPVTQKETAYSPPPTKKYVLKSPPKPQQQQQLPKNEAIWKWYKFKKDLFPNKTDFVIWMSQCGFNVEEDFRSISKNDSQFAKVEMKQSVFAAMNGLCFKETPVQFFPV